MNFPEYLLELHNAYMNVEHKVPVKSFLFLLPSLVPLAMIGCCCHFLAVVLSPRCRLNSVPCSAEINKNLKF